MTEPPVSWPSLIQAGVFLVGLGGLWLGVARAVRDQAEQTRKESREGRRVLHARLDKLEQDLRENYVRRTEMDHAMRGVHHSLEELSNLVGQFVAREERQRINGQ